MPPTDILVVLDAPADLGEEVDTDKALNNAKQWLSDFASNFVLSDQETRVITPNYNLLTCIDWVTITYLMCIDIPVQRISRRFTGEQSTKIVSLFLV